MRYFYECGICECLHPCGFQGDCRDDANRFSCDDVANHDMVVSMEEADAYPAEAK